MSTILCLLVLFCSFKVIVLHGCKSCIELVVTTILFIIVLKIINFESIAVVI